MRTTGVGDLSAENSRSKPNQSNQPHASRPSRLRQVCRAAFSAAVCVATIVMTFSIAPAVLAMSDRQDLVRWFNQVLDLVGQ
jgi:hypothetical protein